jgi:hypothetical protein
MRKFDLELHPEKTRLLEFGPFAIRDRQRRGEGRPETFNFLGFTHICGKKRSSGRFTVLRQTVRKRLQAKLNEVKAEPRRRMHHPIPEVGQWLRSVVDGHNRYYGVPMNDAALHLFRLQVGRLWHRAPSRRSQNGHVPWARMHRLIAHCCILFASIILILCAAWALSPKVRAGCGKSARPDPRRGSWSTVIPTPTLPSLRSSTNHSLLGSRSRHCYAMKCFWAGALEGTLFLTGIEFLQNVKARGSPSRPSAMAWLLGRNDAQSTLRSNFRLTGVVAHKTKRSAVSQPTAATTRCNKWPNGN